MRFLQLLGAELAIIGRPDRAACGFHHFWNRALVVELNAGGPGRAFRFAGGDVVQRALLRAQVAGRNRRRQRLHRLERAPVEGLNDHARTHAFALYQREQRFGEIFGRKRVPGSFRRGLDFDVEVHVAVACATREREHLCQRRHVDAVHALLVGKAIAVLAAGLDAATSKCLNSSSVISRTARVGGLSQRPSVPRVMSGLRRASWLTTTTPSLVIAVSSSSVLTPINSAAAMVTSSRPRSAVIPATAMGCVT